jgi:hypothetical protein
LRKVIIRVVLTNYLIAPIMKAALKNLSLSDLRSLARDQGLSQNGNKTSIIKSLQSHIEQHSPALHESSCKAAHDLLRFLSSPDPSQAHNDLSSLSCVCTNESGPLICCTKCGKTQHLKCVSRNRDLTPYLCPLCLLQQLGPFDAPCEQLLKPWLVRPSQPQGVNCFEVAEQVLTVPPALREKIEAARGRLQLQLRCVKLDGECMAQSWPARGALVVNGKVAMRFDTSANPNAKKRKDLPLNVTELLPAGKHTVGIINQGNTVFSHVAAVFVVEGRSIEELVQEVISGSKVGYEECREKILNTFRMGDQDIRSSSMKFNLKCPYTMTLMDTPVRGVNCGHLQCFNLRPYISIQKTSRVNLWKCPICGKYVYNMLVDRYFESIVNKAKQVVDAHGVEVFEDATFKIFTYDEQLVNTIGLPTKRKTESEGELLRKVQKSEFNEILSIDD